MITYGATRAQEYIGTNHPFSDSQATLKRVSVSLRSIVQGQNPPVTSATSTTIAMYCTNGGTDSRGILIAQVNRMKSKRDFGRVSLSIFSKAANTGSLQSGVVAGNAFLSIYQSPDQILGAVGLSSDLVRQTLPRLELSPRDSILSHPSAVHLFGHCSNVDVESIKSQNMKVPGQNMGTWRSRTQI